MTTLKELKNKARQCKNIEDIFELELSYDTSNGTPTNVQDFFRELKADYILKQLRYVNLNHAITKFYNYSMQGYCELQFDETYEDRLKDKLDDIKQYLETEQVSIKKNDNYLRLTIGVRQKYEHK